MNCKPQGYKISVDDYRKALKNYVKTKEEEYEYNLNKYAKIRTQKNFNNLWGLLKIPTFEEAKQKLKKLCEENSIDGWFSLEEEWDICLAKPPYKWANKKFKMLDIVKDNFIYVDNKIAEFVAENLK